MAPITLKGNTFDLAAAKLNLPPNTSDTNYILIECSGPLKPQEAKQPRELQVFIEEYGGNEAYLCRYPPPDLAKLEKLSFVKNAVVYPTKVKISPELRSLVQTEPQAKAIGIHLHDGVEGGAQKILEQISAITKPVIHSKTDTLLIVTIDAKFVERVAALDSVRSIGLEHPVEFDSTVARTIMKFGEIIVPRDGHDVIGNHIPPVLDGAGQIITVADNGFDIRNKNNVHPAFTGRIEDLICERKADNETNDASGHGTHVSGCALGDRVVDGMGAVRGTAPGAKLIMQALGSRDTGSLMQ